MSPEDRAEFLERFRRVKRRCMLDRWRRRQAARAAGLPSLGLPLVPWPEAKPTPWYGLNNPLRYQESSEDPPRLDLTGSRL